MNIRSRLTKVLVAFLLLTVIFPSPLWATPIFEGYYKVSMGQTAIGYLIQRYDIDSKNQTFSSTYYLYTKTAEGTSIESLNAKASLSLVPISYQYTQLEGKKSKLIDAVVKDKKLVLKIMQDSKTQTREVGMSKNTFFSTFLSHLMLKDPKGIQVGNKFSYEAVAEEDGTVVKGEAFVKEQVKESGATAFRVLNTFKKQEFVNWMNIKGETLKTQVPDSNITAELMANPKEAYKNMDFNQSTIKLLFGEIPEGRLNMLNKK